MPVSSRESPIPFGANPRSELPHTPDPHPLWTEYYYFNCYDPTVGTGITVHIGRESFDRSIWRATLGIYLPGGEQLLVSKTSGRNGHARGGGTGALTVSCIEPFRLWSIEFDGAVQGVSRVQNMSAAHQDSTSELASFFIRFEGAAPLWDMREFMKNEPWASDHWEQIGRIFGEITIRGKTYSLSGMGVRDHSCGRRDYAPLISDFWANMLFPSGTAIMASSLQMEGQALRRAYIYRNDGTPLELAELVDTPPIITSATSPASVEKDPMMDPALRNFRFSIRTRRGIETIEGELLHSCAITYLSPSDEVLGTAFDQLTKGQTRAAQLAESVATYRWNGETGSGTLERLARLTTLK
jgi:hypothetical protein